MVKIMNDAEIINGLEDSIEFICKKCQKDCKRTPCDMHFYKNIRDLIKHQQAEIERLNTNMDSMVTEHKRLIKNTKSEAIKEFAERLKAFATLPYSENHIISAENIELIAREMTRYAADNKNESEENE